MCSYGGKIQPRPHDNQLTYVGGDTKILAVDRNIRFSSFISKLSALSDAEVCFKYQLPGEDLDALISVTNDEDLDHMMLEYDRLFRASARPPRMRLFLFLVNPSTPSSFTSADTKSERQWFVDALNSVQIGNIDESTPTAAAAAGATPDFLFGLEKSQAAPVTKSQNPTPDPTVPEVFQRDNRSNCSSEDQHQILRDPMLSPLEIQRQMHEFQKFQISSHEEAFIQRKSDEATARAYYADYYAQKPPEMVQPVPQQGVPVAIQQQYWQQERQATAGGYPGAMASANNEQVYLIPSSAGMYQTPAMRPVTGPAGQSYYGMQRMVPEVQREQPVYNMVQQQRPPMMPEQGYTQVGYDAAGRQVYYTTQRNMVPTYQTVGVAPDVRQDGVVMNQDGKVIANASHSTSEF
jgi:hypothetical protein